jgi:hypothetical protein
MHLGKDDAEHHKKSGDHTQVTINGHDKILLV